MKFIIWIREDGRWVENGDGPMPLATARRVTRELRNYSARMLPVGMTP